MQKTSVLCRPFIHTQFSEHKAGIPADVSRSGCQVTETGAPLGRAAVWLSTSDAGKGTRDLGKGESFQTLSPSSLRGFWQVIQACELQLSSLEKAALGCGPPRTSGVEVAGAGQSWALETLIPQAGPQGSDAERLSRVHRATSL